MSTRKTLLEKSQGTKAVASTQIIMTVPGQKRFVESLRNNEGAHPFLKAFLLKFAKYPHVGITPGAFVAIYRDTVKEFTLPVETPEKHTLITCLEEAKVNEDFIFVVKKDIF